MSYPILNASWCSSVFIKMKWNKNVKFIFTVWFNILLYYQRVYRIRRKWTCIKNKGNLPLLKAGFEYISLVSNIFSKDGLLLFWCDFVRWPLLPLPLILPPSSLVLFGGGCIARTNFSSTYSIANVRTYKLKEMNKWFLSLINI